MHLFGKNPAIADAVVSPFPTFLRPAIKRLLTPLLSRLYIGMCFLHSDDSATIHVQETSDETLYEGCPRRGTRRRYFRLLWFMYRNFSKTGLLPIPVPGALSLPGSSVHYGASLPVDEKGRLSDVPSVSIADAAGLPDIPAGSYTLSIMAQAHRIGTEAGREMNR